MTAKKKISNFQRNRIISLVNDTLNSEEYVNLNFNNKEDIVEFLYQYTTSNNKFHKTKNNGQISFHILKSDDEYDILVIYSILEFDYKDKDFINLNESVVNIIDFLEKIFIELQSVEILREDVDKGKHRINIIVKRNLDNQLRKILNETK